MSIKRTLSLVLALAMVFSLVSPGVTAYAEGLEDNSLLDGFTFVETVLPTCSADGYDLYTNEEGGEIHTNVVPATGEHVWGEGVVTAPTCVADGFTTYTCTVCGETKTETGEPVTDEHAWDEGVVTAPTCVADGFTTYTCTVCGATTTEAGDAATGVHVWDEGVVTDPTCGEDGYTTYTCTVCGATTTEAGDAATGEHVWDEGVCTVCGADDPDYVAPAVQTLTLGNRNSLRGMQKVAAVNFVDGNAPDGWTAEFYSLTGAVEAAGSTDEYIDYDGDPDPVVGHLDNLVTMSRSATLGAVTLKRDVTLDINGKKLTLSEFSVSGGALIITGTGTIEGDPTGLTFADGYYYENGQVVAGHRYTVSFYPGYGANELMSAQTINQGLRATDPGDPTRTGYTFAGWKDEAGYNWDFSAGVFENKTLTAQWTAIEYGITYDLAEGSLPAGQSNPATYTIEDSFTLNDPSKGELLFVGWTGTDLTAPTTPVTVTNKTGDRAYTAVFAVAQVDDDYYETLQTAVDAANGKTVTLLCDVELDSPVSVSSGAVTLDLAGFDVTGTADDLIQIASGANLTVKDSSDPSDGRIMTTESTALNNSGTLKLEGGAIEGSGIVVYNEGDFTMSGGKVSGSGASNVVGIWSHGGSLTLSNGEVSVSVTVKDAVGVLTTHGGSFEMTGGKVTVSGKEAAAVQMGYGESAAAQATTVNISGGEVSTSGSEVTAAIMGYSGGGTITVSGTAKVSSTATDSYALYVPGNATIEVVGGSVEGTIEKSTTSTGHLTVSDGTFSEPVPEEYCEEGYIPKDIGDGTYGVKSGSYMARVDSQGYETFAEAVTAAGGTKTIVLEASITDAYTMAAGQTLMVQKGTFSLTVTPPANYILITSEAEGVTTYTLTEAVASIGDDLYATLTAAFADAQSGDVVNVVAGTVEIPNTAVIPAGVTLKGDGKATTTLVIASTSGSGLTINNANVTIKDMTIDGSQITSGSYKTLVNVRADGCLIDNVIMTGGGQSTWNSSILIETLPATATFTVSNSTIRGAFRGVLRESCSANIVITNCDITATYPFNIDGGDGGTVTVTGGELSGWTSYGNVDKVTFTNVKFSKAGYDVVAAYSDTDFVGCTFDGDLNLYNQTPGFTWNVDASCTKNGVPVTAANFKELFSADPDVWNKSTANAAVAVVGGTTYYSNIASDDGTKPTDMTAAVTAAKAANYEGYTFYADPTAALQTVDPNAHRVGVANGDPAGTWRVVQGVQTIVLDKTSANLNVGEKLELTPTVGPEGANNKEVVWSSSDETVATVAKNDSKGVVTPKNIGTELTKTVKITATAADGSGVKAECTVTVVNSTAVARVGDKYFGSVADAVADEATVDGSTVEILQAGTYTLPNLPKNITVKGNVVGVVFSHTSGGNVASIPNGASFENVTFEFGNVDYHGFQHNGGLTFTNCTINGKLFSYGNEDYNSCTFNQTNGDYNMWVYGGNVTYTGCTFNNTVKGKFLNVYNESTQAHKLKVENCTFVNGGEVSKAAINIKESCGTTALNYDVEISGTNTIVGEFPANSESATTNVYGNGLFQVDDRFTNGTEPALDVAADTTVVTKATPDAAGEPVSVNKTYPIAVATVTVGETTTSYASLNAALQAAATAHADATVTLLSDIDLTGETWTPIGADGYSGAARVITIQGENKTITGLSGPLFGYTWSNTEIKFYDLTVKGSALTGLNCSGAGGTCNAAFIGCISASRGTVFSNCHVVNCTFSGSKYTGAFYGYAAGYSAQDNGPVFADITITGCSVVGCTISGTGSSGAIAGHATGDAWTQVNVTGTAATGNSISGETAAKTGILFGTAGVGHSAYGKDGGVNFSVSESGNTLYVDGTQLTGDEVHEVGRIGSNGGTVTVTPGGAYSVNPILTSDPTTGTIAPTEDYEITENDQGVYSVTPMPVVARVNGVGYTTLQKAVNAAQTIGGEVTITLVDDISGALATATIPEVANFNVTVDGAKEGGGRYTITDATITIDGKRTTGGGINNGAAVTIQNIDFVKTTDTTAAIKAGGTYPHDVTIQHSSFTGFASNNNWWAIDTSGDASYYWTLNDLDFDYCRMLTSKAFNFYGRSSEEYPYGLYANDLVGTNATAGINNIKTDNAILIENCKITTGKYAFRDAPEAYSGEIILKNNEFTSTSTESDEGAIVVRGGAVATASVSVESGIYNGQVVVLNNKEAVLNISGGHFKDPVLQAYCAENCMPKDNMWQDTPATPHGVVHAAVKIVTEQGNMFKAYYETFEEAVTAFENGDAIVIVAENEIVVNSMITLEKNLLIRLNGKTLTGAHAEGAVSTQSVFQVVNGATLSIDGTTENSVFNGRINVGKADNNNGNLVLNGGAYACGSGQTVVHVNGECRDSDVSITNATITSQDDNGIQLNGAGMHSITNSTISGKTAVYVKAGTVSITGSTLTSTAAGHTAYDFNGNGSNPTGDAIVVDSCAYPGGNPTVKLGADNTITVKDGVGNVQVGYYEANTDKEGYKSGVVTATSADNSIPDGYCWQPQGTTPETYKLAKAVATVTIGSETTQYASLAEAIAAANAATGTATITMVADTTITDADAVGEYALTIQANKNVVLDLNGKTVSATTDSENTYALILNKGILTIQDSSADKTGTITVNPTKPWVYSAANPGGYASNLIRNEGKLIVNSGTLYNAGLGSACYAIDNYSAGKVTVNGGTIDAAKASAIRLFKNNGGSVTVNDGQIGSENSYMGIQVQNGSNTNVTVTGGTVDGSYSVYSNASGDSSVTISGGEFPGYVGIAASVPNNNISISGGTFESWVGTWGNQTGFISSGKFVGQEPDKKYIAPNKAATLFDEETQTYVIADAVAQVTHDGVTTGYLTLAQAIAAAVNGDTVTLLKNASGDGIVIPQGKFNTNGLTVDFGGFTYTVTGNLVGSSGTQNQCFQLLKDNKVTFKNGTIAVAENLGSDSNKSRMIIQNYSDLTLDGMTLDGTKLATERTAYTLSNNNGTVEIKNSTITSRGENDFAFDVCRYASYPSVSVTVTGTSAINGNVELSASANDAKDGMSLTLTGGTMSGSIVLDNSAKAALAAAPDKAVVTKADGFSKDAPEGYFWKDNGDNTASLAKAVAMIGTTPYASLAEAIAAVPVNGATVTEIIMVADETDAVGISVPSGKNFTVDFNNHTYIVNNPGAGSSGTETQAFQLLKDSAITFKNGTIAISEVNLTAAEAPAKNILRVIQNYANLTLENMTIDGRNQYGYYQGGKYALSFNNGTSVIKDTKIITSSNDVVAFDVYLNEYYTATSVEVKGSSSITGTVEVAAKSAENGEKLTLTLTGGTLSGDIKMGNNAGEATITKQNTFNQDAPDGYVWVDRGNGTSILKVAVASVTHSGTATNYASLAEAIAAAQNGDTITMIADSVEAAEVVLNSGASVTLDLNGHVVTANDDIWVKIGSLTVVGSAGSAINSTGYAFYVSTNSIEGNTATLTINSSDVTVGANIGVAVMAGGVVNMQAGTINGTTYAIASNGSNPAATTMTITGGTLNGKTAIYHPGIGTLTVGVKNHPDGHACPVITGVDSAIEIRSGTLNVYCGTITATNDTYSVNPNGNGTTTTGAAIAVAQHTTKNAITATLSGGTLSGTKMISVADPQNNGTIAGTANDAVNVTATESFKNNSALEPGYVWEKDETTGNYVVAKAAFSVTVTSSGDGTINGATVSPVSGGMTARFGETVTVTAKPVNGYNFVGWYDKSGSGTQLSPSLKYDYIVRAEYNDLVAVFKPAEGGTFRLTVTGSRFTINGGTEQRQRFDDLYTANAGITLKFVGNSDEKFLYWVNASGKILSTSPSYPFDLVMSTEVQAVTSDATLGNEALVVFVSSQSNGQVLSQRYYSKDEEIIFPAAPSTMGKTFTGWTMTEDEIHDAMADSTRIKVYPVFTSDGNNYTVKIQYKYGNGVINEETTEPKPVGEGQIVTVPETYDGHYFVQWTDEGGNVLGTTTSYGTRPTANITLIAVYGDSAGEQSPVVFMTNMHASQSSGKNVVNFTATRSVPSGYTIEGAGILYAGVDRVGTDPTVLANTLVVVGKPSVVVDLPFTGKKPNDTGTGYFSTSKTERQFVARGYVIVKNSVGKIEYIYSNNVVYASYSELTTTGYRTILLDS